MRSAERFEAGAGPFLCSRLEHNILATVLASARRHPVPDDLFAIVTDREGEVVAAALRVGARRLLASVMDESAAVALLGAWLPDDPELPGVAAPAAVAGWLVNEWERRTGRSAALVMAEALHTLERVRAPRGRRRGQSVRQAPATGTC